ncbi:phosphate acyltransferase [Mycobacterium sp. NPDC003449]
MHESTLLCEPPPIDLGPAPTAVVQPSSAASLRAVHGAYAAGLIAPTVIGHRQGIVKLATKHNLIVDNWVFHEVDGDESAADLAVSLAAGGEVAMMVKGNIKTDVLMRAVLQNRRDAGTLAGRLSHIFAVYLPEEIYHKPLYITDGAINVAPSPDLKRVIADNAIDFVQSMGIPRPKVAVLSATETVNVAVPSSIAAADVGARIADRADVLGPVALDIALSGDAAAVKGITSPVAGDADLLVCPNIETANGVVKMAARNPRTVIAGLVVGGSYPIALPSRGDSHQSQLASCGLGRRYLAWLQHNLKRR